MLELSTPPATSQTMLPSEHTHYAPIECNFLLIKHMLPDLPLFLRIDPISSKPLPLSNLTLDEFPYRSYFYLTEIPSSLPSTNYTLPSNIDLKQPNDVNLQKKILNYCLQGEILLSFYQAYQTFITSNRLFYFGRRCKYIHESCRFWNYK